MQRFARAFSVLDDLEYRLCRSLHGVSHYGLARQVFALASRLGNGMIWYALLVGLPLMAGKPGLVASISMALGAIAGLLIYTGLKHVLVRERPFIAHLDIDCLTAPLDRYSFPSGHTLHAVFFAVVGSAWFPLLGPVLFGFAALVALSRPVLGLHYPTDVVVGGLIGWSLALLVLHWVPAGTIW